MPGERSQAATGGCRRCAAGDRRCPDCPDGSVVAPGGSTAGAAMVPLVTACVLASALVAALATWVLMRPAPATVAPVMRFNVDLGPEAATAERTTVAVSPDGRRIIYPIRDADGTRALATRPLDQATGTRLPGTENGADPSFRLMGNCWFSRRAGSSRRCRYTAARWSPCATLPFSEAACGRRTGRSWRRSTQPSACPASRPAAARLNLSRRWKTEKPPIAGRISCRAASLSCSPRQRRPGTTRRRTCRS